MAFSSDGSLSCSISNILILEIAEKMISLIKNLSMGMLTATMKGDIRMQLCFGVEAGREIEVRFDSVSESVSP